MYLDPAVFSEEATDPNTNVILQKLISMEANYVVASQAYPGTISWQRTSVQHSVEENELKVAFFVFETFGTGKGCFKPEVFSKFSAVARTSKEGRTVQN